MLVTIGVIMVFSSSYARAYFKEGNSTYYFARQAIFAVLGIGGMLFVSRINYQLWRSVSFIVLAVTVFFLLLVPIFGTEEGGAKRWIWIGFTSFQPSELAKVAIVLTFATLMSTYREKMQTFRYGVVPFALILLVICGLVALEKHFSCILILLTIGASMMFLGGTDLKWFGYGAIAVGVFAFLYLRFMGYASARVTAWRDPASDPAGDGYQILQSLYAIGSGGLMGLGLGQQPAEIPLPSRGAQRLHFPDPLRGARLCGRDGGVGSFHAAHHPGLLDRDARARPLRRAHGGGAHDASCLAGVFEHRRCDKLPARDWYFAAVFLLWRHGASHRAL